MASIFMNNSFKGVASLMSLWVCPCLHVCNMWEHGGCLKYVPQDANLNFGHLDYHDLGTCKTSAMTKGT
jgi:hypothetical protein